MQIVIAEDDRCSRAERFDSTKYGKGFRAAIHEIAYEPKPVRARVEFQLIEEPRELVIASLDVADRVGGHGERGGSSSGERGFAPESVEQAGHREGERRDVRIELRAVVGKHLIAALHRANRRFEDGAARISEPLPRK